jgi:hypothetical protein
VAQHRGWDGDGISSINLWPMIFGGYVYGRVGGGIASYGMCIVCSSPKSGGHRSSGHHNQSAPLPLPLLFPVHHTHPPKRHLGEVEIWAEILGNQTTTTASPGSSPWKSLSPSTPGAWVVGPFSPCTATVLWYGNWDMNFLRFLLLHSKYSIIERTLLCQSQS